MDKIAIIGTGLIGTSVGMALKKAQVKAEIVGSDRDRGIANRAQKVGGVDSIESNPLRAVNGAKVVVLATPIRTMEEILKLIATELEDGCVVTDTGSTKATVLKWAEEHLPSKVSFVGGHPMAGKEASGPDAAQADLFQGATYCLMPARNTGEDALSAIVSMVESMGAKPYFIDPVEHDSFVGAVSHLPMVLSTVLTRLTSGSPSWPEIARLASTGYRDVSRLASQEPSMNRDICLTNQEGLVHWIDEYIKELYSFRNLVKEGGEKDLYNAFDAAWEARDRWVQNKVTAPAAHPKVEIPTTAETMGGMLLGDRAAGRVREMMDYWKDDDRRRRG